MACLRGFSGSMTSGGNASAVEVDILASNFQRQLTDDSESQLLINPHPVSDLLNKKLKKPNM